MAEFKQFKEITLTHSSTGRKMKQPITFKVPVVSAPRDIACQEYIIDSLSKKMPSLLPFAFENETVLRMATHLIRHTSKSSATLYQYLFGVHRFSEWIGQSPDQIFKSCQTPEGYTNPAKLDDLKRSIDDFMGDLQALSLAPGTISNHIKGMRALFRASGTRLDLPFPMSRKVKYSDRAPSPEQLQRLIDMAPLREKVILCILALTGMREGTLVQLQYRHIMQDLEAGISPIHLHIEAEITKGKYADYDTFLGGEGPEFLKAYLETRRRGTRRTPPEILTPESPLIRDGHFDDP